MPPKGAKKIETSIDNKAAKASKSTYGDTIKTPSKTPSKTPKPAAIEEKKVTPKKAKVEIESHELPNTGKLSNQISVKYDHSLDSKHIKTGYTHTLKLASVENFKLVGTATISEGNLKDCQVIILQAPQAFEITKLTPAIRKLIYDAYFAFKNVLDEAIPIEGKRKGSADPWAKSYAEGSKYRVALLASCKLIHQEALPVLYAKAMRVGEPASLLNFLGVLPQSLAERLRHIKLVQYKGPSTKTAMNFLGKATNIIQLEIENGVAAAAEPAKAAEIFHGDIRVFLNAITASLKSKSGTATKMDALDVIHLGRDALASKDRNYTQEERLEFFEALRAKVQ